VQDLNNNKDKSLRKDMDINSEEENGRKYFSLRNLDDLKKDKGKKMKFTRKIQKTNSYAGNYNFSDTNGYRTIKGREAAQRSIRQGGWLETNSQKLFRT